jgi:hypothetical protein
VTGSPFVLAGLIIVILAIVGGIAATMIRPRSESSFSPPTRKSAYVPPGIDEPTTASPDLSRLDSLTEAPAPADADAPQPPPDAHPPPPADADVEPPFEVIDDPERGENAPLPSLWAHLVDSEDGELSVQDRLDVVARLEMVGEKWCIDALNSAIEGEQDPQVKAAARAALTRIDG